MKQTNSKPAADRIVSALASRPATKAALANRLKLSYAVVHKNVNALIADGKIEVVRFKMTGKRGRPASILGVKG